MAPQLLFLLCFCISLSMGQFDDCIFTDEETGYVLDLSGNKGDVIKVRRTPDENTIFNYSFSICSNDVGCQLRNGTNVTSMFLQLNEEDTLNNTVPPFCTVAATWDDSKAPTYDDEQESFTFVYNNGFNCVDPADNSTFPRHLIFTVICGENLPENEYDVLQVGETDDQCIYEVTILSKAACTGSNSGSGGGDDDSNNLSAGSVMIIIFVVIMFLYCTAGCVLTGCRKFPHQSFCM